MLNPLQIPVEIEMTQEFKHALELMEAAQEHVFITGRAGTGKSTLLRHYMATTKRRAAVLAPTGLAAINVGGQTIHSFFKFPPRLLQAVDVKPLPWQQKMFDSLDTLIIDEISMVRADVLDAIDRSLRLNRSRHEVPFGGVQIVAFGDLHQLSPVVHSELYQYFTEVYDTPYFFSADVLKNCDWQVVELTHNYRQSKDPYFFELLSRLGRNDMSEDDLESLNSRLVTPETVLHPETVMLTATNASANQINAEHLAALDADEVSYAAQVKGEFDATAFPADEGLTVKVGAQVMFVRNDPEKRWVNGDIGIVEACSLNQIRVRLEHYVYDVQPVKWERIRYAFSAEDNQLTQSVAGEFKQFPLRLAWAITIHKSQGQTLKHVLVDLGRGAFAHGQTYVALSRCESLEGLWLTRPVKSSDILFDDRVLRFLERAHRA